MRTISLLFVLIIGSTIPNDANAGTKSMRASIKAQCVRVAAAQNFGRFYIQRRNFVQNCIIDPEFNSPDFL